MGNTVIDGWEKSHPISGDALYSDLKLNILNLGKC